MERRADEIMFENVGAVGAMEVRLALCLCAKLMTCEQLSSGTDEERTSIEVMSVLKMSDEVATHRCAHQLVGC